jgi:replicative DNA helicase
MAALEYRVLTELLREQTLTKALKSGLKPEHFQDAEARHIFRYLQTHWFNVATYKTLPSVNAIKRRWPAFEPTGRDPDEQTDTGSMINELKAVSFGSDARMLVNLFQELVEDGEPEDAFAAMKAALDDISYRYHKGGHLGVVGIAEQAMRHYEDAMSGSLHGIPWPWDPLTSDTMGKRPGNFVVFYGRMKSMKTWALLHCAVTDYQKFRQRVLFWSKEMHENDLAPRIGSLLAKVDYQLFKKGRLPQRLKERAFEMLQDLVHSANKSEQVLREEASRGLPELVVLSGPDAPETVGDLRGAIETYQPEVLYLDSFYHLRSDRSGKNAARWSRITDLAEDIKKLALETNIPIIATHQANRAGEKLPGGNVDLADSDAIAREADLVIRIVKSKGKELHEEDYEVEMERQEKRKRNRIRISKPGKLNIPGKARPKREAEGEMRQIEDAQNPRLGAELALVFTANREGVLEAIKINATPGYNFSVIETNFSTEQVKAWVEQSEGKKFKTAKKEREPKHSKTTFKKMMSEDA